ncbi:MAG: sulfur carrier protein ThiS [Cellvibrionaceae bacterium]
MITVFLNGEDKSVNAESNLLDAIDQWELGQQTFAIAVNKQFVPKSAYQKTQLLDGDQVELLIPMQGG